MAPRHTSHSVRKADRLNPSSHGPMASRKNRRQSKAASDEDSRRLFVPGIGPRRPRPAPALSLRNLWPLRKRRNGSAGAAAGVGLLALFSLLLALWNHRTRGEYGYRLGMLAPGSGGHPFPGVCSHQVLNPPVARSGGGQASPLSPAEGSLDAMTALWDTGGVSCFDIDVVTLSDGSMVASHPRRLNAAIERARLERSAEGKDGRALEEHTLGSIRELLGLRKGDENGNLRRGVDTGAAACPFPLFDEEVLPHFAGLVRGVPGAFSSEASAAAPEWTIKGPMLNIDLKQGPYLTEARVLKLAEQIHTLGLEDYAAVCVNPPPAEKETSTGSPPPLDLLEVMHGHNTEGRHKREGSGRGRPTIPLALVLRDLVPEDGDTDRIRKVVEELYPESIRSLVPSFKFPIEWYRSIRQGGKNGAGGARKNELWKLPMTVWTIDSAEDYRYVSSVTMEDATSGSGVNYPLASAVVANKPMELIR